MLVQYITVLPFMQLFDNNKIGLFFAKVLKNRVVHVIICSHYGGLKSNCCGIINIRVSLPCSISFTKCVNYVS